MTQKHKHADVLIAIAEGKEVWCEHDGIKNLEPELELMNPLTHPTYDWRIKPEPKPDVEVYVVWDDITALRLADMFVDYWQHAIKLIFDAETNEFKKVEVVK